jgi:two-component system, cell cycle response regulator DivK
MKILVVEDNQDYRELLSYYLLNSGFEVVIARNGREAIDCAERHLPQMILMDLNLPVMDGWEATRLIKELQATAHIPVLAISANCSEGKEKIIAAGAVGCVQKPIDITLLPDLILSYAEGR